MTEPPRIQPEQIARMMTSIRDAFLPLNPLIQQTAHQLAALRPYLDLYEQDPEAFRQQIAMTPPPAPGCHCLCGLHRNSPTECAGEAAPGLTVRVDSPSVGTQHVPMCRPCADAYTMRTATAIS
ncbi:DUF6372 family protein [Streptomyces sp. NRRL F-5135]|uniref:DUF6372 family protein n=1 Tax=Streptomyces sp. NRRL F-5135 TaxID=1463858 RepID=UPI0004C78595|nr:DUF6372 family protein [Streptomyces sp. NRRL F-5135]